MKGFHNANLLFPETLAGRSGTSLDLLLHFFRTKLQGTIKSLERLHSDDTKDQLLRRLEGGHIERNRALVD